MMKLPPIIMKPPFWEASLPRGTAPSTRFFPRSGRWLRSGARAPAFPTYPISPFFPYPQFISSPAGRSLVPSSAASPLSPAEHRFLFLADVSLAAARLSLHGVQNSRAFAALLRAPRWAARLLRLAAFPAFRARPAVPAPHSAALTYLPRGFALAQAVAVRLLTAVLPDADPHRGEVWRAGWHVARQLLPGDEFPAVELVVQGLLDPPAVKRFCEGRGPRAACAVDLDVVTQLLVQEVGEGALVEHSQALHRDDLDARQSLRLLPLRIPPSLPLLPQWFLMPFMRLRFRKIGETGKPFTVQSEEQAVALLRFVRELETAAESPLDPREKPLRCYGALHVCLAGNAIVLSPAVNDAFDALLAIYLECDARWDAEADWKDAEELEECGDFEDSKKTDDLTTSKESTGNVCQCRKHDDCIRRMSEIVPKSELLDFLDRVCRCVSEEYYFCPLVLRVLLLFLAPCRDWNQRVLLLNFFLDHSLAGMLLEADFQSLQNGEVAQKVEEGDILSALKLAMKRVEEEGCVWEEKEEVMEMYIRYLEQATTQGVTKKHVLVINHMVVELVHYVKSKYARYRFYERELCRIAPFINFGSLLE